VTPSIYIAASDATAAFLADPAIAAAWDQPSALPEMSVGSLAAHLGRQVILTSERLAAQPPAGAPVPVLEHYLRSAWLDVPLEHPAQAGIRETAETEAAAGPEKVGARVRSAADALPEVLNGLPADRLVWLPWAGWALTLEDYLVTRTLEIVIHFDDLAVSVDATPPELPEEAVDGTLVLLTRLAVRRHGPGQVLRALSRAERAPASIAAL
jgi:hypothetical protein